MYNKKKYPVVSYHVLLPIEQKSCTEDINFKQAYDSIKKSSLWRMMNELGIPANLVRLVKACVQNSKCNVKFNYVMSDNFSVETGLRLGDELCTCVYAFFCKHNGEKNNRFLSLYVY
ncbi:Reverse transcriptase domain [Cinara cedri]|uniref:Reverse transcriptase domain n=1 Tax=Cinara cedri TaxID=506608 RepID=A0A5E4MAZ5_9HEMI|nr:Reverse transcriptase domain [Cinara cedri]